MNNETHKEAIELARTLAADIATRAGQADREGCLPAEDVALLRESGYLALAGMLAISFTLWLSVRRES